MKLKCTIHQPMTSEGDKRHIWLDVGAESFIIQGIHTHSSKPVGRLVDPLHGNALQVKVPFRYNRVMCCVTGDKTIQELASGDTVSVELKFCGWWVSGEYGGPSWKLVSVRQESAGTASDSRAV